MSEPYSMQQVAGWADLDANAHMGNSAYLNKASDLRFTYFTERGFSAASFRSLAIGPVVMRDELEYFREISMFESFTGTLALAGCASDGSRMRLRNEFLRADGKVAARLTSVAGWMDLRARRLIAPPPELLAALLAMPRTADFTELPSSLR